MKESVMEIRGFEDGAGIAATDSGSARLKAGLILLFFVLLNILNFVDRQLLAGFAPAIVKDLNLSDTEFGLLNGIVFVFFYAFMGLVMGAMADRTHRPRLIAVGLVLWSALTAASGLAHNFLQLAGARMLIGVGESTLTPAAMSMTADLFKPEKRGVASGIYYMGIPIGAGTSFVVAGIIGSKIGWRNTFYLLGVIGVALSLVLLFIKDPERGFSDSNVQSVSKNSPKPSFGTIFRTLITALKSYPALVCIILGVTAIHVPLGNMAFEQLWLVRERGLDPAKIATIFGGLFILSGLLGNILGGVGGDWLNKRRIGGRMQFLAWVLLVMSPFVLVYRFIAPGSFIFYVGMFLLGVYYMMFYGPVFATIQELVPVAIRSTIVAFALLFFNVIGVGIGVGLSGLLSDFLRNIGVSTPLTWVLFISGLIGSCSVPLFFLSVRFYARDRAKLLDATAPRNKNQHSTHQE